MDADPRQSLAESSMARANQNHPLASELDRSLVDQELSCIDRRECYFARPVTSRVAACLCLDLDVNHVLFAATVCAPSTCRLKLFNATMPLSTRQQRAGKYSVSQFVAFFDFHSPSPQIRSRQHLRLVSRLALLRWHLRHPISVQRFHGISCLAGRFGEGQESVQLVLR